MCFASMHNLAKFPDTNLPICNGDILEYFVCHCTSNLKLCYTTIKSYLAGIRNCYIKAGYNNPLCNSQGETCPRLELLLRGVKKEFSNPTNTRLPITGYILRTVLRKLQCGLFGSYLDVLMQAACLLAFFGFLRCGEFTTKNHSFDPQVHLTLSDVVFATDHVLLNIKASKTDPFRQGCKIPIYANGTEICPLKTLKKFILMRKCIGSGLQEPFFLLPGGYALSRQVFLKLFNDACHASNISTVGISGHSFRIGAATTASEVHTPDYLVQTLGRWKSLSYTRYTRIPPSVISQTQRFIAAKALQS